MNDATAHLKAEAWTSETRRLLAKALGEFAHERLLEPEEAEWGYLVQGRRLTWTFSARRLPLDHWDVDPESVTCLLDEEPQPLEAGVFFADFAEALGMSDEVLQVYLEEVAATVNRGVWQRSRRQPTAAELARADFQTVEAAMTAGHPCFVAGSGRIGWSVEDYAAYAPEAGEAVPLVWVALDRTHALFSSTEGTQEETIADLAAGDWPWLRERLAALRLSLEDVVVLPVHPWQWRHKIATGFAAEIAFGRVRYLGEGTAEHQAQQSIRTFFNRSKPTAPYVKTAMSVLNMGFMRGLSTDYMAVTPAINDFVAELVHSDDTLRKTGVRVLREHSAAGYWHPVYTEVAPKGSPYRKFLAALWRESPVEQTSEGEQLATMASLLHVDGEGNSLAAEHIRRSGQAPGEWLRSYLDAYLVPLLHCLYKYGLCFMPHGENVILVLDEGRVDRVFMKDIGEEIGFLNGVTALPEDVGRTAHEVDDWEVPLTILTDVVDCFLRFLSAILDREDVLSAEAFWTVVGDVVRDYQAAHPELEERFERWDLLTETFRLSCLNRLQLRDNTSMVDLENQSDSLQYAGELDNPLVSRSGAGRS
ncbi:IucA/IucC family protein [Salininema proteolyticum]|uniref:IucA/IucC family protein n=1 Tax=Salininema proteolyticum TaxID=1607685 RepID=A0ABV8U5Q4_9ACTN